MPVAKTLTREPYRRANLRRVRTLRLLPLCAVAALLGCTRMVGGAGLLPPTQIPGRLPPEGVEISRILLDNSRMRGITGAGEELTIIPSMDTSSPVDIDELAATLPPPCRYIYAENTVFGREFAQFRKITYQYPPKGALISEGAAVYPDPDTARSAFDALIGTVAECADSSAGPVLVGDWAADQQTLHTRAGACGRSYLLKTVALLEVTHCGFSESIADLVVINMAAGVPG